MGLLDKWRNEFLDLMEWFDDNRDTLVWQFPGYQNEFDQRAPWIIRPGQYAVFVHRGQLADVFEPGKYQLKTDNLPILNTISGWKYGFNSPFRSEFDFVIRREVTEQTRGTPTPIMLSDPDFGSIRLPAFGTFALKCVDPRALPKERVGTDSVVSSDGINEVMSSTILPALADLLTRRKNAALYLAANDRSMGETLGTMVVERVDDECGIDALMLNIVKISLPEAVEKAIDTRSRIGVIRNLGCHQQFQMGGAITVATGNRRRSGRRRRFGNGFRIGQSDGRGVHPAGRASCVAGCTAAPQSRPQKPPTPPGDARHITINVQSHGPFTATQVAEGLSLGQIEKSTPVWQASMAGWQPLSEVPQLAPKSRSPSPPSPPPPMSLDRSRLFSQCARLGSSPRRIAASHGRVVRNSACSPP